MASECECRSFFINDPDGSCICDWQRCSFCAARLALADAVLAAMHECNEIHELDERLTKIVADYEQATGKDGGDEQA